MYPKWTSPDATIRLCYGAPVVRITITPAAYAAIKASLAKGANEPPPQSAPEGVDGPDGAAHRIRSDRG